MTGSHHAFEFLDGGREPLPPCCVVFGNEPFLKQLVLRSLRERLQGDDADGVPVFQREGNSCEWRDVADELHTRSLFGNAPRLVIVVDADDFVSANRGRLEQYVAAPCAESVLVLEVQSWPGNTRLAKQVAACGLTIVCRPPEKRAGRNPVVDRPRLIQWIVQWGRQRHQLRLKRDAAEQVLELVGEHLGLIDQELAKLALYAGPSGDVTVELVSDVVGGWRTKTAWELLDAAASGEAATALKLLDRMLVSGEYPQALFGAMNWSLSRFALATRLIEASERKAQKLSMRDALSRAGVKPFPHGALQQAERQLRQLGRRRAGRLYQQLLAADVALKGSHSAPTRGRFVLERLILQLSREAAQA